MTTADKPIQPKLKPLDVSIKSINTLHMMVNNNMTNQATPVFMVFGLGDNNVVYTYNNDTKEWREM